MVGYAFPRWKAAAVWWHGDTKVGCAWKQHLVYNCEREAAVQCASQLTQICSHSSDDFSLLVSVGELQSSENLAAVLPFFPKLWGLHSLSSLVLWIFLRFIRILWYTLTAPGCLLIYSSETLGKNYHYNLVLEKSIRGIDCRAPPPRLPKSQVPHIKC